jgi:hypothetical protein
MKKRVAILIAGQTRTSKLNPNYNSDDYILDYMKKNFITNIFKERYDYDVFISTDKINLDVAIELFGEGNIKNIHLVESDTYLFEPIKKTPSYSIFHDKYSKIDFGNSKPYYEQLFTHYRKLDVCNLMFDYQIKTNTSYDYVIYLRPDLLIINDLLTMFDILENNVYEVMCENATIFLFKYEYIDILKLIEVYGSYREKFDDISYRYTYADFIQGDFADIAYKFCTEIQQTEHIYSVMKNKNLDPDKSFHQFSYGSYIRIHRGDGLCAFFSSARGEWREKIV